MARGTRIIVRSSGYIWAYGELGMGSVFKVRLPRVDPVDSHPRPAEPAPTSDNETVLVVEDEASVRRVAERILTKAGYRVLCAATGSEALRFCEQRSERIDLMLTDVVMPHMSGSELHERALAIRPALKVLFMSGYTYTDNSIAHHGALDRDMRFIGKPFSTADLLRKVREVLDEKPASG